MSVSVSETVQGFDVVVNAEAEFTTISGRFHTSQLNRADLVSRIAFLKREAAREKFGHFYEAKLEAFERALVLMDGDA